VFHTDEPSAQPWDYAGVVQIHRGGEPIGSLVIGSHGLNGDLEGRTVTDGVLAQPTPPTKPLPSWSTWAPPSGSQSSVANAIAQHVGSTYLRDSAGNRLVAVRSAPAASKHNLLHRPIIAIAIRPDPLKNAWADHVLQDPSSTWTYDLCGSGGRCSIAGTPSLLRAQLVTREALELALYTFEYEPGIDAVTVFAPALRRASAAKEAFYVRRNDVAQELSRPLVRTLPRPTPPLPTRRDAEEAKAISHFQLAHLYTYSEWTHPGGTSELLLHPAR
jgi:hypothetical protein